jgi:hypothetical protein
MNTGKLYIPYVRAAFIGLTLGVSYMLLVCAFLT